MKYIVTLISLLITSQAFAAANITARLSHNPVSLDESFHLIYEADSTVDGDPDFSVLTGDFEILSSSQSTNMRSVNGSWSLKKSWDLALISKQAGVFTIPPVAFGSDSSPAVRVTVKPSTSNNMQGAIGKDAYFIEVTTDRKTAWVESEIIYTIRFMSSIKINRPTLSEPETSDPDAIIEQLDQVASYQKMINGTPYTVSELRFAVYPQHSGTLTFKPIVFEGRIPAGRRSNSLFDQFMQSGTLKRMRSKSISVKIKPKPAGIAANDWLPAENISVEEEWSEDIRQLRTGEPVTRTLTIKATGQTADQLNDIDIEDVDGVKQYQDKAVTENQHKRDGITAIKQIKIAMIPTKPGTYLIPEINIPWWNTRNNRQEYARLPETLIEASGLPATAQPAPPLEMTSPLTPGGEQAGTGTTATAVKELPGHPGFWPWLSLALAVGWITTSILLFRTRRTDTASVKDQPPPPILPLERAVEKACASGDANSTKDALLAWAAVRWPGLAIASLADIAAAGSTELSTEINRLNSALYSAHSDDWQPRSLLAAFHGFISQKRGRASTAATLLEPLYKT